MTPADIVAAWDAVQTPADWIAVHELEDCFEAFQEEQDVESRALFAAMCHALGTETNDRLDAVLDVIDWEAMEAKYAASPIGPLAPLPVIASGRMPIA